MHTCSRIIRQMREINSIEEKQIKTESQFKRSKFTEVIQEEEILEILTGIHREMYKIRLTYYEKVTFR